MTTFEQAKQMIKAFCDEKPEHQPDETSQRVGRGMTIVPPEGDDASWAIIVYTKVPTGVDGKSKSYVFRLKAVPDELDSPENLDFVNTMTTRLREAESGQREWVGAQ